MRVPVPARFVLPLWVWVNEAEVWAGGLPGAVQLAGDGAAWVVPVFTRRRRAEAGLAARGLRHVRPLAVADGMVLEAVVTHFALRRRAAVAVDFRDGPGGFALVPALEFVGRLPAPVIPPAGSLTATEPSPLRTRRAPGTRADGNRPHG